MPMPSPRPLLVLNRRQCREVDRRAIQDYGLTGLVLMENAGRGVAERLLALGARGPVVVCCGRGNNGGDGFVIARHLDLRGVGVRVILWGRVEALQGDAGVNARVVQRAGLPLWELDIATDPASLDGALAGADWVIDCLLGTGAAGPPRPPLAEGIARINASGRSILAVDVPSGLDCDTGQAAEPTIRATRTCTFVATKPGFLVPGAERYTGPVDVIDIGVPRRLIDEVAAEAVG
jgi:NAD(P)H-hydrate epimerase